ncbi:N-acetylglucosamine-6-phosphate deacetylase [Loktanella salsilacus]|uniref:N-acetylglucosamine-6-phosphate deacetylase n=1 Tax=Loktanella salsilacus TaxID=195913 RepID=UPI0037355035
MGLIALTGCDVHDGTQMHAAAVLLIEDGVCAGIVTQAPKGAEVRRMPAGILAPGLVDLQVNGGGGVMFNDAPTAQTLRRMIAAHRGLGTTAMLPTLITDTAAVTRAAIAAGVALPDLLGLHLEGPHLSVARKGAHEGSLIRPMTEDDLNHLCDAAQKLRNLMVTVAAETVSADQIARLTAAGVVVSLGHSNADFDTCAAAFAAGAGCTTHLFNAMSGFGHRAPGLVGATLDGAGAAGLIADGIHVHPAALRMAVRTKVRGALFLVSDAMAVAGTDLTDFMLNGRQITRAGGQLTLADGTLAGADLSLPQAIAFMAEHGGVTRERAIAMATSAPAGVLRRPGTAGHLCPGQACEVVHLSPDLLQARLLDPFAL